MVNFFLSDTIYKTYKWHWSGITRIGKDRQPGNEGGCSVTEPFDFAQGRELVERQMAPIEKGDQRGQLGME